MARRNDQIEAVEEMLVEATRLLLRMPDRERIWLRSGERSFWPAMVKDIFADYADREAEPRMPMGRREMALIDRVYGIASRRYLLDTVLIRDRPLVRLVLLRKAGRLPGGFRWEDVWEALGGKRSGATTDGLRKTYERCLDRLAARAIAESADVSA